MNKSSASPTGIYANWFEAATGTWSGMTPVVEDATGHLALDLDSNGNAYLTWLETVDSQTTVKSSHYDQSLSAWTPETLVQPPDTGIFWPPQQQVLSSGDVWLNWYASNPPTGSYVLDISETGSSPYYVHNDHLGTPRTVTDKNQQVVWAADYKPYGEATVTTRTIEENNRFPGQYFDEESNFHYNYFRDYDPSTGRYLQSDPIGILRDSFAPQLRIAFPQGLPVQGTLPSSLNHLYGYAEQNPLIYADPLGLLPKGRRPKIPKDMCSMDCQTFQQALYRLCQGTGVYFFACKAEVDQLIVDCLVKGGPDVPECKEEEPCENK